MLFSTVLFSCKTTQEINRKRSNLDKLTPQEILVKNSTNPKMKGLLAIKSKVYFKIKNTKHVVSRVDDTFKSSLRYFDDVVLYCVCYNSCTLYVQRVIDFGITCLQLCYNSQLCSWLFLDFFCPSPARSPARASLYIISAYYTSFLCIIRHFCVLYVISVHHTLFLRIFMIFRGCMEDIFMIC